MAALCVIICAAMLALFASASSSFVPPEAANETTDMQAKLRCSTDLTTVKGLNILLLHSMYGPVEHLMKSISSSLSRLTFDTKSGTCFGVGAIAGLLDDAFNNCTVEAGIVSKLYAATEFSPDALLQEDVAEALDAAAMLLATRSGPKVIVLAPGFIPDTRASASVAEHVRNQGIAIVGVSMDTDTYLEANPLSQVVSTQEFLHVSDPYLGDDLFDAIALADVFRNLRALRKYLRDLHDKFLRKMGFTSRTFKAIVSLSPQRLSKASQKTANFSKRTERDQT